MTGNRSLDEFAAVEPAPEPAEETHRESEETATPEPAADPDEDPAATAAEGPAADTVESTYDWTPGGAPCAACGTAVEERWRGEDGLVCIDCKVW